MVCIHNPKVGGSIPPPATNLFPYPSIVYKAMADRWSAAGFRFAEILPRFKKLCLSLPKISSGV